MTSTVNVNQQHTLWPIAWKLPLGLLAVCSTRLGGVSLAPFDSLNLGDHVLDDPQAVAANRAIFQAQMGGAKPIFLTQVHGTRLVTLDATRRDGLEADACITRTPNLACTIMVADCLPVLFTDDSGQVVAAAHAGWRGLSGGVLENTVQEMLALVPGLRPKDIVAWMGPAIGSSAFEVGDDVLQAFSAQHQSLLSQAFKPIAEKPGKYFANLYLLAREQLRSIGIEQIDGGHFCTVADSAKFFSYRRDKETGRFASLIWISDDT